MDALQAPDFIDLNFMDDINQLSPTIFNTVPDYQGENKD